MRASTRMFLVITGVILLFLKLFLDLYNGSSNGLTPNIGADSITQAWPFYNYARSSVHEGILPLWNSYTSLGTPFLAEIGLGLFYPLTWIVLLVEVPVAMVLIQFLTVLTGMAGMYCYTRYLGLVMVARYLTVVLFAYAVFTESFFPTFGYAFCWIPTILWLCHRLVDNPSLRNACYVAGSLALCFLGGIPNHFIYTAMIVGVYFTFILSFSLSEIGLPGLFQRAGMASLALCLMMGLIAVQLLPGYELSILTFRNIEGGAVYDSTSFWEVFSVEVLFKNFIQTGTTYLWGNSYLKVASGVYYLGGALLFIPFAFVTKKDRKVSLALGFSAVFLLAFIMSYQLPALSLLQKIPFAESLRGNSRAASYVQFLLIVMAGVGFSSLFERLKESVTNTGKLKRIVGVTLFSAYAVWIANEAFLANGNFWYLAGFLPCVILIMLTMSVRLTSTFLVPVAWIMLAIIVLDVSVHRQFRFLVPAFSPSDSEFIQSAASQARNNTGHDRLLIKHEDWEGVMASVNIAPKYEIFEMNSYLVLTMARWENYIEYMLEPDEFDRLISQSLVQRFYGLFSPDLQDSVMANPDILGLASVRYVFTEKNGMLENKNALPRAYAVGHYVSTTTEEGSLHAIKEKLFPLRDSVVLEKAVPSFLPKMTQGNRDKVQILNHSPNEVVLSVSVKEPSIVVLTDAYYPGWEAFVDGKETTIFRANSLFRAVEVPGGNHKVVFRYRPTSLYLGAGITFATLLLVIVMLVMKRFISPEELEATKIGQ